MSSEQSNESPWCNPCQSYHPVSQPCFDAATAVRCSECGAENGWHRTSCLRHPRFIVSSSERRCGECGHEGCTIDGICACGHKCVFPATGAGEGEQRLIEVAAQSYVDGFDAAASPVPIAEGEPPQCYWCKHPDHSEKVCPVPHLATGKHGLAGSYPCGCSLSSPPPTAAPVLDWNEDRCMFCGGKTPHEPDCSHGRPGTTTPSDAARKCARAIVGTVFENTAASHETLRAVMIERIADYLLAQLSSSEPPSVYNCSCGAACTAEEYIEHLLKGHDQGHRAWDLFNHAIKNALESQ